MYWFSFGSQKSRSKKIQQHNDRKRREDNLVIQIIADRMVARASFKTGQ